MGFFQDLKEDLSQAVTEMMDEEKADGTSQDETTTDGEIIDETNVDETSVDEIAAVAEEALSPEAPEDFKDVEEAVEAENKRNPEEMLLDDMLDDMLDKIEAETETEEPNKYENLILQENESMQESRIVPDIQNVSESAVDETAIITKGMSIKGDVESKGSMDVVGSIEGNIRVLGKLNVTGNIKGDSHAAEVFADAAKIVGEITSEGTVKIGASSVIVGNIIATCAVIAGAVKGDIDVKGPVVLDTSAIVMGNIKSKSVQINNGAVIEGLCSQCYAEVNPVSFFDDFK